MKRKLEKIPPVFLSSSKHGILSFLSIFYVGCLFFMHWHMDKRSFSAEQVHERFFLCIFEVSFFMLTFFHGLILSKSPLKNRKKNFTFSIKTWIFRTKIVWILDRWKVSRVWNLLVEEIHLISHKVDNVLCYL